MKRTPLPEKEYCQPLIEDRFEGQTKKKRQTFPDRMDAIAYGVEARYELITAHSRRVIEETVAIARELGIPHDKIERWATHRLASDIEQVRGIKSLLERPPRDY